MAVKSLTVEDCHFVMLPVKPDKVKTVAFVPEQTEVVPETDPPTEVGKTETDTGVLPILSQPLMIV